MLLEVDALAAYQQDPNPDNLLLAKVFRACPIEFVGHTPNGRHIDCTGDMFDLTYCLFESFISKVVQARLKIEKKPSMVETSFKLEAKLNRKNTSNCQKSKWKAPYSKNSTPHKNFPLLLW